MSKAKQKGRPGGQSQQQNVILKASEIPQKSQQEAHQAKSSEHQTKLHEQRAAQPSVREQRAAYNRWKTSLACRKESKLGPKDLQQIWIEGYNLLEIGDGELHGRLLADLVDKKTGGPFIISRTMVKTASDGDRAQRLALYEALLKVVTHSSLLDLPSAPNNHFGMLYAIIGKKDGVAGIEWMRQLTASFNRKLRQQIHSLLHLTARALEQLVDRYPSLRQDSRSSALCKTLNTFSSVRVPDVTRNAPKADGQVTPASTVTMGNIPTVHAPQLPPRAKQPQLVMPSATTKPGGRHDNDFPAISGIQILPTHGEIMSQRPEYLPTTDFTQESFHKDSRKRYIDTLFRLYRHNLFSTVKDFLREHLAYDPAGNLTNLTQPELGRNGLAHFYAAATIQKVDVNPQNGISCTISFLQLPHLRNLSQRDQGKWWVNSLRLEPGKLLVMVVSHEGRRRLLYLIIRDEWMPRDQSKKFKEMMSGKRPRVQVRLAQETESDINLLNELHVKQTEGHLFELCGLIPQAYEPTLTNIQRMSQDNVLVFQKWIIPTSKSAQQHGTVPPPKYARKPGFVYKLDCITKEKRPGGLQLNPNKSPKGEQLTALQKATGLNASQAQALVAALSQEFVQIQGPPGTGKTYVGLQIVKVLVAHKTACQLSPIFIV